MRKVLYILGQLTDSDSEWLAKNGICRRIPKGTVLIAEGSVIDKTSMIIDGTVSISIAKLGEITRLTSGEIVGEISLVDSRPASASVTALTDAVILELPRATLNEKIAGDTAFAARFYRAIAMFLADRMRSTVQRMGYGSDSAKISLDEDIEAEDEIDSEVLDKMHLAGARFDRIFKRLISSGK